MEPIQIIGIKELDDMEIDAINRLANRYYPKIQRELHNEVSVTIHIKKYEEEGRQCKYDVHLKVNAPTKPFFSTKGVDWDINKALHKAFKDIERQLEHRKLRQ